MVGDICDEDASFLQSRFLGNFNKTTTRKIDQSSIIFIYVLLGKCHIPIIITFEYLKSLNSPVAVLQPSLDNIRDRSANQLMSLFTFQSVLFPTITISSENKKLE